MFSFLKPKSSVEDQALALANSTLNLWINPGPKTTADIATLLGMGCNKDRLCIEMTAFTIFSTWYGISMASEQGKLKGPLYERLRDSFFSRVTALTESEPLPVQVSLSYDSLAEMLSARLEHYLLLNSCESASEGRNKAIEYLCDFICDDQPSSGLKFYLLSFLNLASCKVFDTIAGIRLE